MNIANIFGLHLGCMAHCNNGIADNIGKIMSVKDGWVRIKYTEFNDGRWFEIKDCKLLLKPLSAMSEEDKREFTKKYVKVNDFVSRLRVEFYNKYYCVYTRSTSGWSENIEYKLSIDQLLWFASKGYDIGIVPDEYKEVTE